MHSHRTATGGEGFGFGSMARALNVHATIKPPPTTAPALAVAATLTLGAEEGMEASTLKSILFDALLAFLDDEPPPAAAATSAPDSADDALLDRRGVVPVVLALEATVGPDSASSSTSSTVIIPLVRSAAVYRAVRAVVDRGRDYWVLESRGAAIHDEDEPLHLDHQTLDVNLVPLHTVPLPPFIVSSTGTQ